jgi:hypothetical protein
MRRVLLIDARSTRGHKKGRGDLATNRGPSSMLAFSRRPHKREAGMSICHDHLEQRHHRLLHEIAELRAAVTEADDAGQVTRLRIMLASRERELLNLPAYSRAA